MRNIKAWLTESTIDTETRSIEAPHIVVCRAVDTPFVSYLGPFSSGLEALHRAEHEARQLTPGDRMEYSVASLDNPAAE